MDIALSIIQTIGIILASTLLYHGYVDFCKSKHVAYENIAFGIATAMVFSRWIF